MTKVAKEYGLSDVGLVKVCKRYNIPRPPVWYWMKLGHGYQPKKVPSPPVSSPAALETKLLGISKGVVEAACRLHIARLQQEAEERKRLELQRVREEQEAQERHERARFGKLMKDVEDWQKSQALRAYVEEVRRTQGNAVSDPNAGKQLEDWIWWAMKQADLLDPLLKAHP